MQFTDLGLRPELVRAVSGAGYTTPTSIQERAIPIVLDGRDLIACAQTGTGKTAAFLLPILQRLAAGTASRHPRALVVTPTRELAAQIGDMATRYGRHLRLRSTVIFGGVGMEPQRRHLAAGLDLLVATPGRLLDHIGRKQARLDNVELVVLDEADRMLDMGFLPDVRRILATLRAKRQNLFFSATMPDEIEALIRRTTHEPVMVEVTRRATPVSAVRQVVHPVAMTRKRELLRTLLQRPDMGRTLVFTRTKARANQLVRGLEQSGRRVAAIHGNKSQNARTQALASFRTGAIDTLIATDIAARGLDVDGISHVVNFDLPTFRRTTSTASAVPPEPVRAATRSLWPPPRNGPSWPRSSDSSGNLSGGSFSPASRLRPTPRSATRNADPGRQAGSDPATSGAGRVAPRCARRVEAAHADMQEADSATSSVTPSIAEARTALRDPDPDAIAQPETGNDLARRRAAEDDVTLERFLGVTAGFTRATVRVAMVRALADLRLGTAPAAPLRWADYDRFYRAVLSRLP